MTAGSGLFSTHRARHAHLVRGSGGLSGEIGDLRLDIQEELSPLAAMAIEEFTNPVGLTSPGAAVLKAATATVASIVTLNASDLLAAGLAMLTAWPRQIVFTTAGTTPADAPATAAITGKDPYGAAQTETVTLAQTATTATSTKYWSSITSIVYPAADGTGATVSIGIAAAVVKAATATVASAVTLNPSDIIQGNMAQHPRALVFTTAGTTPADAPATATVTGLGINGQAITETVTLAQTATTATSKNYFAKITRITYPAADGTGATIAITPSAGVGLAKKIDTIAGNTSLIREIAAGSVVTNGTIAAPSTTDLPNGSYTPNAAFNDANDYAIFYVYDATVA